MEESNTMNVRPTFLTVVCILTFLGSGWGIIGGITNYFSAGSIEESQEVVEEAMDDAMDDIEESEGMSDSQKEMVENIVGGLADSMTPDNVRNAGLISILSGLLTLAGAFLMWNLNKKGYLVYILGIAVLVVGMIMVYGGLIGAISAAGSGFVGILFIILYGLNLKHMK